LSTRTRYALLAILLVCSLAVNAFSIERFPPPQFEKEYARPLLTAPSPRASAWLMIDVFVLIAALAASSYLILKRRSRPAVFGLMLFSLAYFGFYKKGCVCSIGAIQDVSLSFLNTGYAIPLSTLIFFVAPLVVTLFFGRSFCGAVCPFGAVQDLTLLRPIAVPPWLEHSLRYLAYVYLALAVWLAAMGSSFIICHYDPYVAIFRRNANLNILILGAALLIIGFFVGRPYCRFLCPYGVILRQISRLSKWRVQITPNTCNQCKLCEDACPYGAIQTPAPSWPDATYSRDKRRLAWLLILLPILIALGAWLGHTLAPMAARTHTTVALAERVWMEEDHQVTGTTDASQAFRASGQSIASLYDSAAAIRARFDKGGWFFGGFLGLVLGCKLILLSLRPRQTDYEADRAGCVSCGRCYQYCPKEHERKSGRSDGEEIEKDERLTSNIERPTSNNKL
jgi:NosR/NirI family transcriptional regulator, nitrous oxide reductase regulator